MCPACREPPFLCVDAHQSCSDLFRVACLASPSEARSKCSLSRGPPSPSSQTLRLPKAASMSGRWEWMEGVSNRTPRLPSQQPRPRLTLTISTLHSLTSSHPPPPPLLTSSPLPLYSPCGHGGEQSTLLFGLKSKTVSWEEMDRAALNNWKCESSRDLPGIVLYMLTASLSC